MSVGYRLFLAWLDESPVVNQELNRKHVGGPLLA
jgi:hypothetical protein